MNKTLNLEQRVTIQEEGGLISDVAFFNAQIGEGSSSLSFFLQVTNPTLFNANREDVLAKYRQFIVEMELTALDFGWTIFEQ